MLSSLQCSEKRFDGVQLRTVECQERASGRVIGNSTYCGGIPKPDSVRVCRVANCDEDGNCHCWIPRKWWKVRGFAEYSRAGFVLYSGLPLIWPPLGPGVASFQEFLVAYFLGKRLLPSLVFLFLFAV